MASSTESLLGNLSAGIEGRGRSLLAVAVGTGIWLVGILMLASWQRIINLSNIRSNPRRRRRRSPRSF